MIRSSAARANVAFLTSHLLSQSFVLATMNASRFVPSEGSGDSAQPTRTMLLHSTLLRFRLLSLADFGYRRGRGCRCALARVGVCVLLRGNRGGEAIYRITTVTDGDKGADIRCISALLFFGRPLAEGMRGCTGNRAEYTPKKGRGDQASRERSARLAPPGEPTK